MPARNRPAQSTPDETPELPEDVRARLAANEARRRAALEAVRRIWRRKLRAERKRRAAGTP